MGRFLDTTDSSHEGVRSERQANKKKNESRAGEIDAVSVSVA